jgi:P-type conjugative transfer protein TrbJ
MRLIRPVIAEAIFLLLGRGLEAQFGGGVFVCANCSTEPTLATIKIMHDLEYAKQVLQYAIQAQQLADMIRNTAHGGPMTLTNVAMDLNQLANVVQGGRALAYSLGGQDVAFRSTFPGYQSAAGSLPGMGTYQSKYAVWAETSLATTQGILRGVGLQGKLLATEQGVLSVLRNLTASNLLDRNDAINLTGQLSAEQVGQLQKLRELQLEDMTSKAAYQGYMIQRQAASESAAQRFFAYNPASSDGQKFGPGWN